MKEWIASILGSKDASLAVILMAVLAVNLALQGLKAVLDYVKDRTETTWDNKAAELLAKVLGYTSKGIEVLVANKQALPAETQKALQEYLEKQSREKAASAPTPEEPKA